MLSMKKLVPSLTDLGFENSISYLHSGNLIFCSNDAKETAVEEKFRDHLRETFGIGVPVIVRAAATLQQTIDSNPFSFEDERTNELHVFLLSAEPSPDHLAKLDLQRSPGDSIHACQKDIYLKVAERLSDSKFTNGYIERTLKVTSTARNWKTITSIQKLLLDREL